MPKRRHIPTEIETQVVISSRRRCCICFGLNGDFAVKKGQITHLDHDLSNWKFDNLAWMCMDHHDEYDSRTSQSKGMTIREVRQYRKLLYTRVENQQGQQQRTEVGRKKKKGKALRRKAPGMNAIEAHLDLLESVRAGVLQARGFTLTTEVRRTEEASLIKSEIRYHEQETLTRAREVHPLPLLQEPARFPGQFDLAYREHVREATSVCLSILVWGPSESNSDLYRKRVQIRNTLCQRGHDARFSEDWHVPLQELGALTPKQQELIQAQLADLIIILYASFGSIAETHDIGNFNDLKMKLLVLVDHQHTGSYGAQGLLKNLHRYNRVYAYASEELRTCSLMGRILEEVDYCRCEKWEKVQGDRSGRMTSS